MGKVLLDSSVFLHHFLQGPKKEKSRVIISNLVANRLSGIISSVCLMEVKYHVMQEKGHKKAEEIMFLIKKIENVEIIEVSEQIAERAADIRRKYYSKERPMSFADAIHIATAIEKNCSKIIAADSDFDDIKEIRTETY